MLTSRAELDITDEASIAAAIDRHKPWAVINTAGFVRTWDADREGGRMLARPTPPGPSCWPGLQAARHSAGHLLVRPGVRRHSSAGPTSSRDAPAPACAYGRSKAEAEARLLAIDADALIVRTSAFFGPWDRYNFLFNTVERLRRGEEVFASDQTIVSPTYVPDLVHATLDLLLDGEKGIWHLTNQGAVSWHDLARQVADHAKLDVTHIIVPDDDVSADTSLTSKRGLLLRPLEGAIEDFVEVFRAA